MVGMASMGDTRTINPTLSVEEVEINETICIDADPVVTVVDVLPTQDIDDNDVNQLAELLM